jgi:hypothetical protein
MCILEIYMDFWCGIACRDAFSFLVLRSIGGSRSAVRWFEFLQRNGITGSESWADCIK